MSLAEKILVIDNYDSFTYNLVQYIGEVASPPEVLRNDARSVEQVKRANFDAIIISPGPGRPEDAGISVELLQELGPTTPILGVCLGLQCIASVQGGKIVSAAELVHGKTSQIYHSETPLYSGIQNPFTATRYHSLKVEKETLPASLVVDALSENGEIMGLHHVDHPVIGVQYHPESVLTEAGKNIVENFLKFAADPVSLGNREIDPSVVESC